MKDESWLVREALARALRQIRRHKITLELLQELAKDLLSEVNRSVGNNVVELIEKGYV